MNLSILNYYFRLAFEKEILWRAIRVAIIVGLILNLINNTEIFLSFSFKNVSPITAILTFFVPYIVSTYSSVFSNKKLKAGSLSHLDAILKCKSCKKTNFHIHIGQSIEPCLNCNEKTNWKPLSIFSFTRNNDEMVKSLALFARHNPQPLLRIDANGFIIAANPATETLFENEHLTGNNILYFLPEIKQFDLHDILHNEEIKETVISSKGKFYNLILKGVTVLSTIHIYGNDITEIVLAERKIKQQAEEINNSIQYAWRIQKAMLPHNDYIKTIFPEHLVFYRPKNTVSGDFYWINEIEHYKIIAIADCTGHGVPGAFMSMLGISILNEIILREKIIHPDKILNSLRERLISSLTKGKTDSEVTDGMDISLAVINSKENTIRFSGAYNPLYVVRNGEMLIYEADRMPVGRYINEHIPFTIKELKYQSKDRIYMFSDGYKDQTGGDKSKKYSSKIFKKVLIELEKHPFNKQAKVLETTFDDWKKHHEQVDDVLVFGISL